MGRFAKLTNQNGHAVYVNVDHIVRLDVDRAASEEWAVYAKLVDGSSLIAVAGLPTEEAAHKRAEDVAARLAKDYGYIDAAYPTDPAAYDLT